VKTINFRRDGNQKGCTHSSRSSSSPFKPLKRHLLQHHPCHTCELK
jgi:hypothetical protein